MVVHGGAQSGDRYRIAAGEIEEGGVENALLDGHRALVQEGVDADDAQLGRAIRRGSGRRAAR